MPRLGVVALLLVASHGAIAADPMAHAVPARPSIAIGYTTHATALAGGRRANVATSRAMLLLPDREPVELVPHLAAEADSWTQFAGWFPDGATAIVGRGWESRDNAAWEEEHREFRFRPGDWLYDTWLVDLPTGRADNVTAVERVSFFNSGLFAWPGDPTRLGFTALVDGISKPFVMNRDGRGKTDLARESRGFAYGFSGSPDGRRVAYHEDYQVWLADADGGNRIRIDTGQPFNFAPSWSPDGRWLLFLAGTHYDCHPHVVRADGSGLRKLADRGGYRGVTQFLDVPDFHGGSSDVPTWSHDGRAVFFTARVETAPPGGDTATSPDTVELFRILLDEGATPERLTVSVPGSTHYHPRPSPDGVWLLIGSRRASAGGMARNLFARRIADGVEVQLTHVPPGRAAMHGHWQPVAVPPAPTLVPAAAAPAK